MSLVRLRGVSVAYDGVQVLREVDFRLEARERVGMIGRNGTGKTSILKLILDQLSPTEGTVELMDGLTLGYFSQFSELQGAQSTLEACDEVFADVRRVEAELEQIADAMAADPDDDSLIDRQSDLFDWMTSHDGWDVDLQIDTVLTKLGFDAGHRSCPIDTLSGGWKNRAALAKMLLQAPDLLLLDEPTNFLDVEGVAWLEDWVHRFTGAMLLVSHDRAFLDRTVTRIVELENYRLHSYVGDYTEYVRVKSTRIKRLERQFQYEETLLASEAEDLANFRKAKARIKKRVTPRPVDKVISSIYGLLKMPDRILEVEGLTKGYGDRPLFEDVGFELRRGQRLAVLGRNGCGKSTLVRVVVGAAEADAGSVKTFAQLPGSALAGTTGIADYNQILEELDPRAVVWQAVNAVKFVRVFPKKKVHRFLELLRLSEDDRNKRIGDLSGGQRARVALAQCLLSGAPLIVLDEPTNHLDILATQVMERALVRYPGAVLLVSHDRLFVDKVATHRLVFDGERTMKVERR